MRGVPIDQALTETMEVLHVSNPTFFKVLENDASERYQDDFASFKSVSLGAVRSKRTSRGTGTVRGILLRSAKGSLRLTWRWSMTRQRLGRESCMLAGEPSIP